MSQMEPEAYLASLEPNQELRRKLVAMIKYVISPRVDNHSIIIIEGPPRSGRSTLIDVLMQLIPHQSVDADPRDVCRIWRAFVGRKSYPLRLIRIEGLKDEDLEHLPMLDGTPAPYLVGENMTTPSFRYLVKHSEGCVNTSVVVRYHHIIKISLHHSFDISSNKIKVNIPALRSYLGIQI
jgi:hypothetical protein